MGLLDQAKEKYGLLMQYIEANTPKSTRPVAKPGKVFDEGLINPNEYTRPQADRFKDSAFGLLGVVPGVGDAASAAESADLFNRGEKFAGSLAALGALPLVPAIGGMFIGKGAKTWDALKAQQAEELLAKGVDPREVWKQTGTLKGVDGAFRQEIPDNAAAIKGLTYQGREGVEGNGELADFLDHPGIYDAYPDTGKIQSSLSQSAKSPEFGSYSNDGPAYNQFFPQLQANAKDVKSPVLHELQHAIQQREGWARGGNTENASQYSPEFALWEKLRGSGTPAEDAAYRSIPKDYDAYRRLAGEAEARLTQSRMGLDAAQRLEHYPYDAGPYGFDVPADQQIVRGLLDGPAMSYADEAAKKTKAKK